MKFSDIKNTDLFIKILKEINELDKYVVLREDENGRYIEYAFMHGAPEENRCLSWYEKLQPNALIRNGHDIDEWKERLLEVNRIYRLNAFTCGMEDVDDEVKRCRPGCASMSCRLNGYAKHWTYEEPVKCGCWHLDRVEFEDLNFYLSPKQIQNIINSND